MLESEAVEDLALTGGFWTLVAGIELVIATIVLAKGAGGGYHVVLLIGWLGVAWVAGHGFFRRPRRWTQLRLRMSHELVEKMVGYRTRLAQQSPERWHDGEDAELARYLSVSRAMDRRPCSSRHYPERGCSLVFLVSHPRLSVAGQLRAC